VDPWWVVVAAVLVGGTLVALTRIREVLLDAETVLDDDHGVPSTAAPLEAMRDDAALAAGRFADVGAVTRHPVRLATGAERRTPWASFRERRRATRPRGGGESP
jgi:hypothetical protein